MAKYMSRGKRKNVDLENRLSNAYNAGYYDGAVESAVLTHEIWVNIAESTKGIGPKIQAALIASAKVILAERQNEVLGKPPQDVEEVRRILKEGET